MGVQGYILPGREILNLLEFLEYKKFLHSAISGRMFNFQGEYIYLFYFGPSAGAPWTFKSPDIL
jgi:hypothetical protein